MPEIKEITFIIESDVLQIPDLDEELVRKASMLAHGGNIHRVNTLIHLYVTSNECLRRIYARRLRDRAFIIEHLKIVLKHEADLRTIVLRNKIDKDNGAFKEALIVLSPLKAVA